MLARGTVSLRDDLQVALDEQGSAETADFSESERTILQNVLKLSNVSVGDVMVERSDIQAIEADVNLGALLAKFRQVGHCCSPCAPRVSIWLSWWTNMAARMVW
jgi:CBS domain containing-hemolysin-like protein